MDLSEYLVKIDHFDKIHVLGPEGKIEGAPNWRQVRIQRFMQTNAVNHVILS